MGLFDKLFGRRQKVVTEPDQVPDLFKQLSPLLDEIGAESIGGTPENWNHAVLTITCDGKRIDYSLKNPHNEAGTASITPRLAQLSEQLYSTMASQGYRWTTAEFRFEKDGESWRVNSGFSYDE